MARKAKTKKAIKKNPEASLEGLQTPTGRNRKAVTDGYKITRGTSSNSSKKRNVRAIQFGQLLEAAMLAKGFNQIRLAEKVGSPRDSISGYCKGENIPGNERLKKIADALSIKPEDLMPNFGKASGNGSDPRLTISDQGDGKSWLQINRAVSNMLAAEIQLMITKEDAELLKVRPLEGLITLDEVCRIFHRTKRQVFRYRQQGLPDYGGRPVMFDPKEVRQFIGQRKHNRGEDAAQKRQLEKLEDEHNARKLLAKFQKSRP